jgi:hypothetical protein
MIFLINIFKIIYNIIHEHCKKLKKNSLLHIFL